MSDFIKLLMSTLAKQISSKSWFLPVLSPGRHLASVKGGKQAARARPEDNRNIDNKVELIMFLS